MVFVCVAVWNFKLAYEYELTDDWEGLFFVSYDGMALIEEKGSWILFYSCAIVVAVWIFRSMKNAWILQRSGTQPEISPGWSVGWYCIPIASLWKSLQAMFEINKTL